MTVSESAKLYKYTICKDDNSFFWILNETNEKTYLNKSWTIVSQLGQQNTDIVIVHVGKCYYVYDLVKKNKLNTGNRVQTNKKITPLAFWTTNRDVFVATANTMYKELFRDNGFIYNLQKIGKLSKALPNYTTSVTATNFIFDDNEDVTVVYDDKRYKIVAGDKLTLTLVTDSSDANSEPEQITDVPTQENEQIKDVQPIQEIQESSTNTMHFKESCSGRLCSCANCTVPSSIDCANEHTLLAELKKSKDKLLHVDRLHPHSNYGPKDLHLNKRSAVMRVTEITGDGRSIDKNSNTGAPAQIDKIVLLAKLSKLRTGLSQVGRVIGDTENKNLTESAQQNKDVVLPTSPRYDTLLLCDITAQKGLRMFKKHPSIADVTVDMLLRAIGRLRTTMTRETGSTVGRVVERILPDKRFRIQSTKISENNYKLFHLEGRDKVTVSKQVQVTSSTCANPCTSTLRSQLAAKGRKASSMYDQERTARIKKEFAQLLANINNKIAVRRSLFVYDIDHPDYRSDFVELIYNAYAVRSYLVVTRLPDGGLSIIDTRSV